MCKHDDIDCDNCCYRNGKEDALEQEPYDNPYKNWSQSNNYSDGYNDVIKLQKLEKEYNGKKI